MLTKQEIRKASPYRTKSRDHARRLGKQQSTKEYSGTGNPARFVLASLPEFNGNKRMLERALKVALEMSDNGTLDRVALRRSFQLPSSIK